MQFIRPTDKQLALVALLTIMLLAFSGCSNEPQAEPTPKATEPTATATNTPVVNDETEPEVEAGQVEVNTGKRDHGAPKDSLLTEPLTEIIEPAMLNQSVLGGAADLTSVRKWLPIVPGSPAAAKWKADPTTLGSMAWKGDGYKPAAPFGEVVSSGVTPIETLANGDEKVNVDATFAYYVTKGGVLMSSTVTRHWTLTLTPSGEDSRNWNLKDYGVTPVQVTTPTPVKE